MKLLLDENLSYKLEQRLQDIFPGTQHVRSLALETTDDTTIWQYARDHQFLIATQDSDFNDQALLSGIPPQIIWIRCGNARVTAVEQLFRTHSVTIHHFGNEGKQAVLEIEG